MIPHSRPSLGPEEEAAALRVIRSGMLAQGAEVAALEAELADYLGVPHVIAVSSGSAALHLALTVLDIQPGEQVLLPAYVCTALLHAVRHAGGQPVLVDSDPVTFQIDPNDAKDRCSATARAIIAPHMFGSPVDLDALETLDLPIIEDCALALGATDGNRKLGGRGVLAAFSFYATKVICGGEGGAIATRDAALAERLRDLRDYDGRDDDRLRFNYKLTDLQAAIVRVQLGKLDGFIARRRELGARYSGALADTSAQLPTFAPGAFPFRYVIRHPLSAEERLAEFETRGIAARRPVHAPLHRCLNRPDKAYPGAAQAHKHAISLPLYPSLSDREIDTLLAVAREVL